jgi:environmental stress-induced protein Ves
MPKIINTSDFKEVLWKNGKGLSREIYCIPQESDPALFNFRLSMATVTESAPFSIYTGIDRFLMLLDGDGVRLKFEDQADALLDSPFDCLEFEGEEVIFCELLKGECIDFNVMTNRSWGKSSVISSLLKKGQSKKITAKVESFIFLYCSSPSLIVLGVGETYEILASENFVVVEITINRKHFH